MSPRKVESQYLCTHGAVCSNCGTTINGKFQDRKLFLVISQYCSSQSLTDVFRQHMGGNGETQEMGEKGKIGCIFCSIYVLYLLKSSQLGLSSILENV